MIFCENSTSNQNVYIYIDIDIIQSIVDTWAKRKKEIYLLRRKLEVGIGHHMADLDSGINGEMRAPTHLLSPTREC